MHTTTLRTAMRAVPTLLIAVCLGTATTGAQPAPAPAKVGSQPAGPTEGTGKYLFIDGKHVERSEGVQRVFHQPVKHPSPLLVPDQPWERDLIQLFNAPVWSHERQRWQLWYFGGGLYQHLLYAESADGLKWEKPKLGLTQWKGSAENNIIDLDRSGRDFKANFIAMLRDDRAKDPGQRFKGLASAGSKLTAWVSADGLSWKELQTDAVLSDDQYRLGYDSFHHRFIATVKSHPPGKGRAVSLALSDDFVNWSKPELIFWGDETDQELGKQRIQETLADPDRRHPLFVKPEAFFTDVYNMPVFTYGDLYLGLPVLFHHSGTYTYNANPSKEDGILYPTLVASRDLRTWDRLSRQPFLPHSKLSDKDNWDYAMIHASRPVRRGEELWFYYTGARFSHVKREELEKADLLKAKEPLRGIFLARLRLDGFASLQAGQKPGTVVTKPVEVTGPTLYVNADATGGEIRAEVLDAATGKPIPGFTLTDCHLPAKANGTRLPVSWQTKGDVAALRGRTVQLSFALHNAHLYAFGFEAEQAKP